jgi:predicted aldo/keto reductase-like oxidoreductase
MESYLGQGIPKLGFGLMRLPKRNIVREDIDQISAMVDIFMEAGFKYFDTAFVYDLGKSEEAIRRALVERYPRESFYLATKLCAFLVCHDEKSAKAEFYTSLERTGAGYFDFYLLHSLKADNLRKYDNYHLWDFVREQKEKGLIRHWGFSFHDGPDVLDRLLTDHPDTEFVQLQINYEDWENPSVASRANYEVARKHGVPVIVMEPVKGGRLAKPPAAAAKILKEAAPDASAASWAIRFAASLDGVITVLSGMSNREQMLDNLSYMKDFKPLDASERAVIQRVRAAMGSARDIPCTSCGYCLSGCPQKINIPGVFSSMNSFISGGDLASARSAYEKVIENGSARAAECIRCGQCERACPQRINVIPRLAEASDIFDAEK